MSFSLDLPVEFVDSVGMKVAGPDLNALRAAAIMLDGLSYQPHAATDASAGPDTAAYNLHTAGDFRLWWGSLEYRDGMTTLTVEGTASGTSGGSTIKVYLDGSGTAAATITPSSSWSGTISIASGYVEGQIIEIDVWTSGNATKTSVYLVRDPYASPIAMPTAWPGVPTFTTSYTATKLNQLASAAAWLLDRMDAVPILPTMGHLWAPATHKIETIVLFAGSVERHYTADLFRVVGRVTIENDAEYYQIRMNGVVANTSATYTLGQTVDISVGISLSGTAVGARADIVIEAVVTNDATNAVRRARQQQQVNSRYSFFAIRSEADASHYPVATPPIAFPVYPADTSISQATLTSRLNAIATMLANVKARIDAAPETWNRARAMRRRFAQDDHQQTKLAKRYVPCMHRRGDRLVVRGQNVSILWGALTLVSKDGELDYDDYTAANSETVTSGDAVETKVVYLDSLNGLYPGMRYYLSGDCHYAAEHYQ